MTVCFLGCKTRLMSTDTPRVNLLQQSEPTRHQVRKSRRSRLSSSALGIGNLESGTGTDAWKTKASLASGPFTKVISPIDANAMQSKDSVTKIVPSERIIQSEFSASIIEKSENPEKKVLISALFVSKMKNKQVRGMITGVGKELRRAASSVGEKIPNSAKRKNMVEKERQELLRAELRAPQPRHPEEIKKAYGYSSGTNHAMGIAQDKLRERGEKLSALQRRTTDLESDAANFSSLANQLAKKVESRKWYEL